MRQYHCTVRFTDGRVKPRLVTVSADSRKAARRAARSVMAAAHPTWNIAQVQATAVPQPQPPRGTDPAKAAAAAGATARIGGAGTPPWWDEYRHIRSLQRRAETDPHATWAARCATISEGEGAAWSTPRWLDAFEYVLERTSRTATAV